MDRKLAFSPTPTIDSIPEFFLNGADPTVTNENEMILLKPGNGKDISNFEQINILFSFVALEYCVLFTEE